jgi:hypothetical protein
VQSNCPICHLAVVPSSMRWHVFLLSWSRSTNFTKFDQILIVRISSFSISHICPIVWTHKASDVESSIVEEPDINFITLVLSYSLHPWMLQVRFKGEFADWRGARDDFCAPFVDEDDIFGRGKVVHFLNSDSHQ